jgi:hypothetical protein
VTEDRDQRTVDGRQMTEDRGQMTEDRDQRTVDGRQMTEDRGQMTDGRRQRSEGRKQRTDDRRQMTGEFGIRPPASPSCRLYLRAGSRRGHRGLRPGGNGEVTGRSKSEVGKNSKCHGT